MFQTFFVSAPNMAFTRWCRLGVALVSLLENQSGTSSTLLARAVYFAMSILQNNSNLIFSVCSCTAKCKEGGVFVQECAIFCLASTLFNLAFYGGEGLYLPSQHYPMIITCIVSNIISPCKNPSFALWHGLWGFCSVDWHHSLAPTQVYVRTLAKSFSSLWPLDLPYAVGDQIICSENTSRILGLFCCCVFWQVLLVS